jgi:hypothetical protein
MPAVREMRSIHTWAQATRSVPLVEYRIVNRVFGWLLLILISSIILYRYIARRPPASRVERRMQSKVRLTS